MSHTVKVQVEFKELPILKKAFNTLKWNVIENISAREYAGNRVNYPLVAVNPENDIRSYDVGIKVENGEIGLFTDFYGGSVASTLGHNFQKLKQQYAVEMIKDEYANSSITQKLDGSTGDILLEVEIY